MKKFYEEPSVEMQKLVIEDVIATSGGGDAANDQTAEEEI